MCPGEVHVLDPYSPVGWDRAKLLSCDCGMMEKSSFPGILGYSCGCDLLLSGNQINPPESRQ